MSFGIKPLGDKVVIKRKEAEEKTAGGSLLASQAKEKPSIGEVLAVGKGSKDVEMEVSVGDTVLFTHYAGTAVKYQSEEYIVLSQLDILAIID